MVHVLTSEEEPHLSEEEQEASGGRRLVFDYTSIRITHEFVLTEHLAFLADQSDDEEQYGTMLPGN